jgi:hypothetical protein
MENEPFFTRDGARYIPTPMTRGPWDPMSLNGRVIVGLLGHVIEQRHGEPDLMPARLTVDMYHLPDRSPVEITTKAIRDGYRIKVIEAEFFSAGASMAKATCQLLRRTENAPGTVWSPPNWTVPAPANVPVPEDRPGGLAGIWASRPITGGMGQPGQPVQKRMWMAEIRPAVGGEALTPFGRCALAADYCNPFSNSGDRGLGYINSDVTLYLQRLPRTEWIGFEVVEHLATDGVAIGQCRLYDEFGPIGSSSVTGLAQKRTVADRRAAEAAQQAQPAKA